MNVNLEKELVKSKEAENKAISSDSAVKQMLMITNGEEQRDLQLLLKLSGKSHTAVAHTEFGKQLEFEKFEKGYCGKIYTTAQIKKLAVQYNLRFLPSTLYTASFGSETMSILKQFEKEANANAEAGLLGTRKKAVDLENEINYNFFILAPEECFATREKIIEYTRIEFKLDPLMFYKIDDNHYRFLYKWGAEFTIFRLISGFKWKSYWTNLVFNILTYLPIAAFLMVLLFANSFLFSYPVGSTIICILGSITAAFIRSIEYLKDGNVIKEFFSPVKWNSDEKIKRD